MRASSRQRAKSLPFPNSSHLRSKKEGKNMMMMMPRMAMFIFLLLLVLLRRGEGGPSAYEELQRHGLPKGLLPKGVREFVVDGEGRFEAHLDEACTAKFESEVRYERNVTGTLSYGQMASLSGISAQELFLWFPVRGIQVKDPLSGLIFFDVGGVVHKQFSLSLFETPPDCSPAPSNALPLHEGARLAGLVSKLRYDLDQGDAYAAAAL